MKQSYKYLLTMCATLLIAVALPQISQANTPVDLAAYAGEGYVRLQWDVSVDTQVYKDSYYKIYRGNSSGFTADQSTLIRSVYETMEFDDYSIVPQQSYYYVVAVVDTEYGELGRSNEVSSVPNASQPHGYYDNKTTKCSVCHSSHEGQAADLVNTELSTAEDLCKICHESGGESNLIIDSPTSASVQNCNQCHNPHGNNKNQKFVPMLLQITIDGEVLFEALNPETNKVGNDFCLTSECHADYQDFNYDPPQPGQAHDNIQMVDNQGPDSTTGITCNACHQKHNYGAQKMLRKEINWNSNSYLNNNPLFVANNPVFGEYNAFCQTCHQDESGAYRGSANYNNTSLNVHAETACYGCHDPHGVGIDKYLKGNYANTTGGSIPESFALCFSCHDSSVTTSQGTVTTKFAISDGEQSVNLHVYHITDVDSSKRAICKDCHSPHGPAQAMNISFPTSNYTTYLKVYEGASGGPEFNFISSGYGSCDLICHDVKHTEENSTYEATYGN